MNELVSSTIIRQPFHFHRFLGQLLIQATTRNTESSLFFEPFSVWLSINTALTKLCFAYARRKSCSFPPSVFPTWTRIISCNCARRLQQRKLTVARKISDQCFPRSVGLIFPFSTPGTPAIVSVQFTVMVSSNSLRQRHGRLARGLNFFFFFVNEARKHEGARKRQRNGLMEFKPLYECQLWLDRSKMATTTMMMMMCIP